MKHLLRQFSKDEIQLTHIFSFIRMQINHQNAMLTEAKRQSSRKLLTVCWQGCQQKRNLHTAGRNVLVQPYGRH